MFKNCLDSGLSNEVSKSVILGGLILVIILTLSCANISNTSQANQSIVETNTYLSVQQTLSASNAIQNDTSLSQDYQATQVAIDAQATLLAFQSTQLSQPLEALTSESTPTSETPPPQSVIETTPNESDFVTWMQSTKILLYEDIAGYTYASRYIKEVLDKMGLPYTDVGDKSTNLISEIKSGGPGGKGWDLVIAASENRLGGSQDFISEVNDAINSGSAVIIEHFNFDAASSKQTSNLYSKCGIEFQYEWGPQSNKMPPSAQVIYPIDTSSPILHVPNENISMSRITDLWGDRLWGRVNHIDYGDLFQKTPGSTATFILGTKPLIKDKYGTLISCLNGKLIIQSFATHNYAHDNVILLWENMIYNALKSRYASVGK